MDNALATLTTDELVARLTSEHVRVSRDRTASRELRKKIMKEIDRRLERPGLP